MDSFTLGLILRQLLQSAGLKNTLILGVVGGSFYACFRGVKTLGSFFNAMLERRDQALAQTMAIIAASDERRAAHEVKLAEVLGSIKITSEAQLLEAQKTRDEMHARLNKVQEDLTMVRGAVS